MKSKILLLFITVASVLSCSQNIEYTQEFKDNTSGKYLFNQDDIIEVFYEDNTLFLKWKGVEKIEPVVLGENEFFVVDMYKKLRFVQHPETNARYISIIPEGDKTKVTYDYKKVEDNYKTPSMYLKDGEYQKALAGFLEIKKQDSTSILIDEYDLNREGYRFFRNQKYDDAIEVFKINVALHPTSDNVYDSLADAYLYSGDSIEAYNNYKKALKYNTGNRRAKKFVAEYDKQKSNL